MTIFEYLSDGYYREVANDYALSSTNTAAVRGISENILIRVSSIK